jgi:hypothetical protein
MKLARLVSILLMCSWVLGMQVWYYGQFAGVLRGLFNTVVNAK